MQRLTTQSELLDGDVPQPDLNANLADIARLNRLTGTRAALCRVGWQMIEGLPHPPAPSPRSGEGESDVLPLSLVKLGGEVRTILDVGTGAADFPGALRRSAVERGLRVRVIAADLHSGVLGYVRQTDPALEAVQLNGMQLPFANGAVDLVTCAQTLHHLTPEAILCLLCEFARVSRIGFVLLDLERSQMAAWAIRLLTVALSRNRLTRHDGPLSARRAYCGSEIAELAIQAGLHVEVRRLFPFRWVATWRRTA